MSLSLHAAKPACQAVLEQCLSSAFQLGKAIKQNKTKQDRVESPTLYSLLCRKVDLLVTSFFGTFFVENSRAVLKTCRP